MKGLRPLLLVLATAATQTASFAAEEGGDSLIAFNGHFWIRMGTHIFAFLAFLWVLRKYAFGPLTAILDGRKQAIDAQFEKVETLRAEAQVIESEYQTKLKEIDNEARARINEAISEGRRLKDEIVDRARAEADDLRAKQERLLQLEVAKARIELRNEIVGLTIAASEKLLRETLDQDHQRRLVGEFIEQVQGLPREQN